MLNPRGISWAGLYASDLATLADFYQNTVGLRIIERGDDCYIFDAGCGALFEVWRKGYASSKQKSPREQSVLIGFLVEHLEPAIEALKARGLRADVEIDSYLGTRWIDYTDPEGNRFSLKDMHE